MDGELLSNGEDFLLRFERELPYPLERVWQAITEPSGLAAWFPSTVEIELIVGGKAVFTNDPSFDVDPELLATTGEVVELDPHRSFAFTWGNDLLRFELSPSAGGCRMVFTHRLPHRACANRTVAGWSVCLDALAGSLAGTAAENPAWRSHYERYAALFGDEGTFSRDGDRATLRFERLMPAPAAAVWSALTDPAELRGWLADATFVPVVGAKIELRFDVPPGYVVSGEILQASQRRVLEYTWTSPGEPGGTVKWQLIPVGDTCLLLLTHSVDGHWDAAGTLAAWDLGLVALSAQLGGAARGPFPHLRWQELHARYAAAV
jgi:uncharacterized protein YndB with AHSA1/START domain